MCVCMTHKHEHTHTHMHVCMHTRVRAHTHTLTHTHTHTCVCGLCRAVTRLMWVHSHTVYGVDEFICLSKMLWKILIIVVQHLYHISSNKHVSRFSAFVCTAQEGQVDGWDCISASTYNIIHLLLFRFWGLVCKPFAYFKINCWDYSCQCTEVIILLVALMLV